MTRVSPRNSDNHQSAALWFSRSMRSPKSKSIAPNPACRKRDAAKRWITRNGTTTLFAALNTLDGSVIAECMPRHSHQEWLRFLRLIDRRTPKDKQLHLSGQLCHPQACRCEALARSSPALPHSFHPDLGVVAEHSDSFAISPSSACAAACFAAWTSSSPPLTTTSPSTTSIPRPSSGQRPPPTSSRKSSADVPPCIRCNLLDALH